MSVAAPQELLPLPGPPPPQGGPVASGLERNVALSKGVTAFTLKLNACMIRVAHDWL